MRGLSRFVMSVGLGSRSGDELLSRTYRLPAASVASLGPAIVALSTLLIMGCTDTERGSPEGSSPVRTGATQKALTSCVNLTATADATLSYSEMRRNLGAKKVLLVGEKDESLVSFDITSIPAAAAIDNATLTLYVSDADGNQPINVHRAAAAWSESTVTFASFAQHFDRQVLGSIAVRHNNVQKSVDLTALTTSWVTGAQPNYGVLLESSAREETTFVSCEGGTAEQKPKLRVCYTTPHDHCTPNPCQNGATCGNNASGFVCHCAVGYTDTTCGANIDDCAGSPCQNGGVCTDGVNGYSCACAAGFTGANCETNSDDCTPSPCQNGGVCADGIASYTCHCPPGYSGANCETLIDNCGSQPCQNGGACANGVNSYVCTCAGGFTGINCEINIDDCSNQPCHNGGTCIDGVNAYVCACPPDWGGAACDVNLNTCSQNPCLNGSTCTNGFGNYTCACLAGFMGTNCEIDINDCAPNPCQNGGICVDGVNSHACTCAAGFLGENCGSACATGLLDCDHDPANGCETVPASDSNNCGACGRSCSLPGVASSCADGVCSVNGCQPGFADLDGDSTNGCEYTCPVYPPRDETCNAIDDDCDGQVDERTPTQGSICYNASGQSPHACSGVVDPMVRVRTSSAAWVWVYEFEAARPDATATSAGSNANRSCSNANVQPWANVTQADAAAACSHVLDSTGAPMRLCAAAEWQVACEGPVPTSSLNWSESVSAATYFPGVCNDAVAQQAGANPTGRTLLGAFSAQCYTDWASGTTSRLYDMSGNLAEWTSTPDPGASGVASFDVRGGAYDTQPQVPCAYPLIVPACCTAGTCLDQPTCSCGAPAFPTSCGYAANVMPSTSASPDLGFRCCADHAP